MARFQLDVNGAARPVDAWDAEMPLLYALRNHLGLHATKFGCGLGQCGACTVLMDGKPVRSCMTKVSDAQGKKIVTAEGLGAPDNPHAVQAAFIAEQAAQCGYCTNGMVMSSVALLARNAKPTREQTQAALAGNLCRCGSHDRVLNAVQRASGQRSA
jgi:nicotinate dehydrogenase subunit A